jgi:hypothetical protein
VCGVFAWDFRTSDAVNVLVHNHLFNQPHSERKSIVYPPAYTFPNSPFNTPQDITAQPSSITSHTLPPVLYACLFNYLTTHLPGCLCLPLAACLSASLSASE